MNYQYEREVPMSQGQLFYQTVVRPYLDPFMDIANHTTGKLMTALAYFVVMGFAFAEELFSTPEIWWKGLTVLVALDFLAGNIRALTDSKINFSVRRWGRSAYKIPAYLIAGLSVGAGANMFPEILSWLQYATFAILSGIEIWSILRNLKLVALITILFEVVAKKYQVENIDEIKQRIEEHSYQNYKKHERDTFMKPSKDSPDAAS